MALALLQHVEMTAPISIPDDGRLRPQDDAPYEDWIADVDRAGDAPEPFFSGRDGDLAAAATAMDMVARGRAEARPCASAVRRGPARHP